MFYWQYNLRVFFLICLFSQYGCVVLARDNLTEEYIKARSVITEMVLIERAKCRNKISLELYENFLKKCLKENPNSYRCQHNAHLETEKKILSGDLYEQCNYLELAGDYHKKKLEEYLQDNQIKKYLSETKGSD